MVYFGMYISQGNAKAGVYSFDIPAKKTCPGMTRLCGDKCYAHNLMVAFPSVARKYDRNLILSESEALVNIIVKEIPYGVDFRIHVSGDFYSKEYIMKWIDICSTRTDVKFYTYTRSWRLPNLRRWLLKLAKLPNVAINLSVDKETGKPRFSGANLFRWCYLTDDDKTSSWIRRSDIIFRTKHRGQKKKRNNARKKNLNPDDVAPLVHNIGGRVCPLERGEDIPLTCSRCQICLEGTYARG